MKKLFIFFFAFIFLVGAVEGATVVLNTAVTMCGTNNTYANDDLTINTTVTVCGWAAAGQVNCNSTVGGAANCGNLTLYANNLTITLTGIINGTGKGYAGATGNGQSGSGPGGGGNGDSACGTDTVGGPGGGGYGGIGGDGSYAGNQSGLTYGNLSDVFNLGSGGGNCWNDCGYGGNGGGAIILNVSNVFNISGKISVNGSNAIGRYGGGGSGGGIWLIAHVISGNGMIYANGGNGGSLILRDGGGGAGRIRIDYDLNSSFVPTISISGGTGVNNGAVGTLYYQKSSSITTSILAPTTASPATVSAGQNVTVNFTVQDYGVNVTSGVTIINATVGTVIANRTGLAYTSGIGWQANITMPSGLTGLQNLFLNISYAGIYANTTQASALNFGGATCGTYSGTGNWVIDSCNYTLTSNVVVDGFLNVTSSASLNFSSYSVNATKYIFYPNTFNWMWLFYDMRSWIIRGA